METRWKGVWNAESLRDEQGRSAPLIIKSLGDCSFKCAWWRNHMPVALRQMARELVFLFLKRYVAMSATSRDLAGCKAGCGKDASFGP